ncbi:PAS domain S-box protein [Halosegnis marinus]|uniref:histidine kinase n=1 Tax=Halosegnis marinus TaxID=3034023 RepID=A0ABD5ZMX7_9EURY|nr:PAS domain S-box protein [Halosegnis sp. DT85]
MTPRVVHVDGADAGGAVAAALSAAGYEVVPAGSVAAVRDHLPDADAVVTAGTLPDGDALDLCAGAADVPVVVYAADPDASVASALFAAGASDYVLRDEVSPEGLVERVSAVLGEAVDSRYRRLVDAVGDFLYVTDEEGRFVTLNDAALEMSGYTREEAVGEHSSLVLSEAGVEQGEAAIRRLLAGEEETVTYEMDLHTKSGERLRVENHVSLLPMPDGEFRGTVGVLRDVSERRSRDERLRELHDATRDLFAAPDREAVAEAAARAAATILGYPINGVRLVEGDRLVPVAVPDETRDIIGERPVYDFDSDAPPAVALREGEPFVRRDFDAADERGRGALAAAMYLPFGHHGTLTIAATDEAGFSETDEMLAGVLAANVAAALDRLEQRAELAAERDRLSALFENIPDPAIYVEFEDGTPVVRDANPAFEATFGYDAATLAGDSVDEYIVPDADDDRARSYNRQIREGESFHGEVRRQSSDGLRDFLLHVVPYEIGERTTRGFAIYTDITDQKERQRELERQNERLEEFAGVVSHDLRNPLNVAAGRLDLGRETGDDEHFEAADRALERMERLIDGLLALARQGRTVGDAAPVALGDAARAAWNGVATGEAAAEFGDLPTVLADRARLEQLFENLFRNSVDHAGEGVTVTVEALSDGFAVADDGPGIPESEREHVLEFGYSTDGGTGFGLAIVREIAEAHGWTMAVEASESGGARFAFRGVELAD